ncbi:MAG: NAD(P)-dependent oxidoreductase, partial [Nitrospirota bacterium]|nr:NAD(P)-dependent oxidoreductase [Nitrospirota bacterium]
MRIFVAGATGVIGRRIIPLLVAAGHQVTTVGRTPEKRAALERMGAASIQLDLFAADSVRQAVAGNEVAINLATSIPPPSWSFFPSAWRENDRIRRIVSANLAEAVIAGGVKQFIQESFAVYPDGGDDWIEEHTPIQPVRYNRSLIDAEASAARVTARGRTGVVLRFAMFYGADSAVTQEAIRYVRRGWAPVLGSPGAFMSSVSHDDTAAAVVASLNAGPGVYNIADDEPVRRREYVDALASILGVTQPKMVPAFLALFLGSLGKMLARSIRVSNRKFRTEVGWTPKYPSIREGWRAAVDELRGDFLVVDCHVERAVICYSLRLLVGLEVADYT